MTDRAIILAGGKGTRLHPYTQAVPKPLVPIGENQVVMEFIIKQLVRHGFGHITVAVNHMANLIMAYFGDGSKWGAKIDYSLEKDPLHTIGPLTLIEDLPEHFLVVNGDTLTDLDYRAFFDEHKKHGKDVSVVSKKREVKVDFGVLEVDEDNHLRSFKEKPTHDARVAIGVNAFSRSLVDSIPKGKRYGFDELMEDNLKRGNHIKIYDFDGFWIDLGRPEDYKYAVENFDEIKKKL